MSPDRPDFRRISSKIKKESQERTNRSNLRRLTAGLFDLQSEISSRETDAVKRIPIIDEEGIELTAHRDRINRTMEVEIIITDSASGNSQVGTVYEITPDGMKNYQGDPLRGNDLSEALAVASLMRDLLLAQIQTTELPAVTA